MPVSGKVMVKKYKQEGWTLDHIHGSHHIMKKGKRTMSIPVHSNQSLKKGLENKLLKELKNDISF